MKTFLVFVDLVERSISHANTVLDSIMEYQGWEVELFPGVTPQTLRLWETKYPLEMQPKARVRAFRQEDYTRYRTKKSCFYNHYRVWHRCVEIQQPVAFVEHDAVCLRDWNNIHFRDVLILHANSALKQSAVQKNFQKNNHSSKQQTLPGLHEWKFPLWNSHTEDSSWPIMMPGTAAYAVTPYAAQRLIDHAKSYGWEQSDHFINDHVVDIQYYSPDFFQLGLENLQLSHGLNSKQ